MENQRLRERFAVIGTLFTFLGLLFVVLRQLLEGLNQTTFTFWGSYIGITCFGIAALAFVAVVYIDETYCYENNHPRFSR